MKQHILVEGLDVHVLLNLFIQKRDKKHVVGYPKDDDNKLFNEKFVANPKPPKTGGSKADVLNSIEATLKLGELENLGIVCDADKKPVLKTWREISKRLKKLGYDNLPDVPNANGTIIEQEGKPKIGVWIMPDNQNPGAIETFFKSLFPENDPLLVKASATVASLKTEKLQLFKEKDTLKSEVSTWLAWQQQPGKTMGMALGYKWLKAEGPLADRFLDWFEKVFDLENL